MSTMPSTSAIVGVFRDRALAEQAMEALEHAGFDHNQMRYAAPGTTGSFLDDIKSLFTGPNTPGNTIANDLSNMGLSDEEAGYYANEYNNGNSIIAVKATDREQEAANILHRYGAYHYATVAGSTETANSTQQPSDYAQSSNNPVTNEDAFAQQHNVQPGEVQEPARIAEEPPFSEQEPGVVTMEHDNETTPQSTHPEAATTEYDTAPQNTQPDTVPSEYDAGPQNTQPDTVPSEYDTVPQQSQLDAVPSEYDTAPQQSQLDVVPTEYNAEVQSPQANVVRSEHNAELQDLLMQIQATQQQLQDARAQLQAAKEHADQLKAAKEREAQLQEARKQLQDVQAELQATLAELHEVQQNIAQQQ
ncbi:MAG: hypothetical protein ACJ788_05210 [Ktedonobacteraceae bacterium]